MRRAITAIALAVAMTACTGVSYTSPRFGEQTADHEVIAVVPFEMVFLGKTPKGLGPEDIERIEEAESLAFQMALYDALLNRSDAGRKRPIRIEIQPVEETRRLLAAAGVEIRDSWRLPARRLGEILGVDALVRCRVEKARYLSDLASFGVDVGIEVLHQATAGGGGVFIPLRPTRTHDIRAESTLVEAREGSVLWKLSLQRSADWTRPADEVITGVTRKVAKKFPYRG